MAHNKLLIPRPISWSGMLLLEQRPKEWVKKYLEGKDIRFTNSGIEYGTKVHESLEKRGEIEDLEISALKGKLKRYKMREFPVQSFLECQEGNIPIFGILDTSKVNLSAYRDTKTGRHAWTQKQANSHGQFHFYGSLIYSRTKVIPIAHVDWIETIEDETGVHLTGVVKSFEIVLTKMDIIKMNVRIKKAAILIDKLTREYIAKNL